MINILQFVALLGIPIAFLGALVGLLWVVVYSSVRLGLRHEVARIERRKTRARVAASLPKTRPRPVAVRTAS